jgi:hypothetical protein
VCACSGDPSYRCFSLSCRTRVTMYLCWPLTLSSDKYSSTWADACLRSCPSSSLLATDDDVDAHVSGGGKQRVKLSFKAAPPVPYCGAVAGVATAAIAAAATAAAAAAVAAAEAEEARLSVHRDFRGKVHIKSTSKTTSPPLPASDATVRPLYPHLRISTCSPAAAPACSHLLLPSICSGS